MINLRHGVYNKSIEIKRCILHFAPYTHIVHIHRGHEGAGHGPTASPIHPSVHEYTVLINSTGQMHKGTK